MAEMIVLRNTSSHSVAKTLDQTLLGFSHPMRTSSTVVCENDMSSDAMESIRTDVPLIRRLETGSLRT